MDQSSKSYHQHNLGVNKLGKNIRKSPLHQPSLHRLPPPPRPLLYHHQQPPLPQPQVYNISKSDFRSVVQQLTGSPAREPTGAGNPPVPTRPPQPKLPSSRLMRIRPPPLAPIVRPQPPPFQNPVQNPDYNPNLNPNVAFFPRPVPSPTVPGYVAWADSPVSAYMRFLESSLFSADGSKLARAQGLLSSPQPPVAVFPSPRGNFPPAPMQPALLSSPGSYFPLLSPGLQFPLLSPGARIPNSQLPLPSPSSFLSLLSPKSPHLMLSPGFQYPRPPTPNFYFSPIPPSGILGPGPASHAPPPPSPFLPLSPSGLLPLLSPRWRNM